MKRKRRLGRLVFFGVAVLVPLLLVVRGRMPRRIRANAVPAAPAGGAAQVESVRQAPRDGGALDLGDIVEDARKYETHAWSFDVAKYELAIEDVEMTTALDSVLARTNADLVVNGGFFDPDGKPVGLAVSNGVVLSKLAKSLSGGVLTFDDARVTLAPTEDFVLPDHALFAVQCRPRLVVDRSANVKSDDGKRAERTALCTRDAGRTLDVVIVRGSDDGESAGPSLFALARHLADAGCESALNLDGGPSTGVAWRDGDGVRLLPPRKAVRHAVVVKPRGHF